MAGSEHQWSERPISAMFYYCIEPVSVSLHVLCQCFHHFFRGGTYIADRAWRLLRLLAGRVLHIPRDGSHNSCRRLRRRQKRRAQAPEGPQPMAFGGASAGVGHGKTLPSLCTDTDTNHRRCLVLQINKHHSLALFSSHVQYAPLWLAASRSTFSLDWFVSSWSSPSAKTIYCRFG